MSVTLFVESSDIAFFQTYSCKDVYEFSTQEKKKKILIIIIITVVVIKCKYKLSNFKIKEKAKVKIVEKPTSGFQRRTFRNQLKVSVE